jgi:uncharacterized protein with PQ loop repeat
MGINEMSTYLNNFNSYSLIHRSLSVTNNNKPKSFFQSMALYGMDLAMIVAPLLTYCFQINKFYKTKSSKGFSKFICFLLFLGNTLRVFFWFGIHFKNTLLYQSLGIIIFQVILIHLCVKYQGNEVQKSFLSNESKIEKLASEKPIIYFLLHWKQTLNPKKIWKWEIEIEYYKFMFLIIFVLSTLSQIFKKVKIFFNCIGTLGAFFEALTCVPQVIENYRVKNSKNVSFSMIFCWFLGDSFRLYYNINSKAPLQLIIGISVQVTLDIVVCIQICMYRDRRDNIGVKLATKAKKKVEEINIFMKKIDEINLKKKAKNEVISIELKQNSNDNEGEKNFQKLDQSQSSDDNS